MQTAKNTLTLTSFPWWAWFFPEYTLQKKHIADAVVEKVLVIPEINLHVSNSIHILLLHEDKQCLAEVTLEKIGTFTVAVPENKLSALHKGDQVKIDFVISKHFAKNKHVAAVLH